MKRDYHRWFSPHLQRDMELLVFGHAGERILVFPTRGGRFFDYENWGLVNSIRGAVEGGRLQLFCVDSVDYESLYCENRSTAERLHRHEQYEAYLLEEVLPLSESYNPGSPLAAHGCSLGAFHAANIAFRHPELFSRVVALSGRYDLTEPAGPFRALLDPWEQSAYYHTPVQFLPNLAEPRHLHPLRRMRVTMAIGDQDAFHGNNHRMREVLGDKEVWNQLHVWSGEAHRARYWRQMVPHYL